MAQSIPLQAVPAQTVSVTLGAQSCTIDILQRSTGIFLNLYVNNAPVVLGVAALDRNRIVRSAYLGFAGDLVFVDTQGLDAPSYEGLGTRWLLEYLA